MYAGCRSVGAIALRKKHRPEEMTDANHTRTPIRGSISVAQGIALGK